MHTCELCLKTLTVRGGKVFWVLLGERSMLPRAGFNDASKM